MLGLVDEGGLTYVDWEEKWNVSVIVRQGIGYRLGRRKMI